MKHQTRIRQGWCVFPLRCQKNTRQHGDRTLCKDVLFLSVVKQVRGARVQSVLSRLPLQGVVGMPDASGVKYIDWPKQTPKTGRLREQVALDVIDNHAVVPGEELADSEESLAASGRGDNQEVAEFRTLPCLS